MKQRTLKREYVFEGGGLHSGRFAHVRIKPAPINTGIVFVRTDLGARIPALAKYVTSTSRSTTLTCNGASVITVEHLISALTGLGVDNALVEIDNKEVPILDGSARLYVEAIAPDGLVEQEAERKWINIEKEILVENKKTGSYVKITPAEDFRFDVTIDFNSHVLGIQHVVFDPTVNYASEVAPCRTFCFLHEIQFLASLGLVKGGDVENAIVVVEKPVSEKKLERMAKNFNQPNLKVTPAGYLSNLVLRFPDECGRHKLLDIIGDLRLSGGFLKAHVTAYKPGHAINTETAKKINFIYG